jgi:hypothetical protein
MELEADAEHQQDDADLGQLLGQRGVGDETGSMRAHERPGEQVADDGRKTEALCEVAKYQRRTEAPRQREDEGVSMHIALSRATTNSNTERRICQTQGIRIALLVLFLPARRTTIAIVAIALIGPGFRILGLWRGWSMTNATASKRLSAASGWIAIVAVVWTGLMIAHIDIGRPVRDVAIATFWSFSFVWLVSRSAIGFRGMSYRI